MGFSSISEVGNRIVSILNRELVPDVLMHSGAIGLCSPEDHGDFTIGVHLYDIGPNDDLVERGMVNLDSRRQTFPSTFLTLHYMITAYSSGDLRYRSEEDHRILGKVIQALSDNSFLGMTSALYGAPMRTRIEMERIDASEKIRLWTFPNKSYRLSLFYRVLPVEILSVTGEDGQRRQALAAYGGKTEGEYDPDVLREYAGYVLDRIPSPARQEDGK